MKYLFPLLIVAFTMSACAKHKAKKQAEEDEELIQNYINAHGLNATATGSGLYYVVDVQGTGEGCNSISDVTVAYTGSFTDGIVFEQSDPAGVTFNLQQVIQGWTEGIPKFNEGGSGKLLIPSALGYGAQSTPTIPANSVLIFDIELIDVL